MSSGQLAGSLGTVSSTAASMGNSMESTLGMLTAITEQTRNSNRAANGLKSIFNNLAQVLDDTSSNGKKINEIFSELGISMYDLNTGQLLSSYELLGELAKRWDTLDTNTKNYIASTIAGTNQLNNFLALMNNFDHAVEATEVALNSSGSAARENAAYMESLSAKVSEIKRQFQEFSDSVLADFVDDILTVTDALMGLINSPVGQFVSKLLLMSTALGQISALADIINKIDDMNHVVENLEANVAEYTDTINSLTTEYEDLKERQGSLTEEETNKLKVLEAQIAINQKLLEVERERLANQAFGSDSAEGITALNKAKEQYESSRELVRKYTEELQKLADQENVNAKAYQKTNEKLLDAEESLANAQKELLTWSQRLEELKDYIDPEIYQEWKDYLDEVIGSIDDTTDAQNNMNEAVEETVPTLEDLYEALQDVASELSELDDAYATLNSVVQEYNETGNISYDSLGKLLDLGYDYISMLEFQDGKLSINNEKLNEHANQLKQTAIQEIEATYAKQESAQATSGLNAEIEESISASQTAGSAIDFYAERINNLGLSAEKAAAALSVANVVSRMFGGDTSKKLGQMNSNTVNLLNSFKNTTSEIESSASAIEQLFQSATFSPLGGTSGSSGGGSGTATDPLKEQNDLFKERVEILEHELYLMEQQGKSDTERIAKLQEIQKVLHEQAQWFRAQGESDESSYIRDLQQAWWNVQKQIANVKEEQKDRYDDSISQLEHELFLMEKNGKSNEEQIAKLRELQAVVHEQAQYYREQGLTDNDSYIQELQKQWWEYEDQIQSIYDNIAQAAEDAAEEAERAWEESQQEIIDSLEQQISDYEAAFDYVVKEIEKKLDSLYKKQEAYEKLADFMVSQIEKQLDALYTKQDAYKKLADYMVGQIDEEIEALEKQKEEEEAYWDEKIEALEKQNEELNEQIELEEALDELARAKQSKVMVYKDGKFQYVQDTQAVSDAQKRLEELKREKEYKDAIEALEKQKEEAIGVIEEQIEYWNKYREEWANLVNDYIEEQDRLLIEQELGIKLEGENWKDRVDQFDDYSEDYKNLLDDEIAKWEDYKKEWESMVDDYIEDQDRLLIEQELGIKLEGENWMERVDQFDKYSQEYKDLMDEEIAKWEEYKDEWSSVLEDYQDSQDKLLAEQLFGIDFENKNWENRLDNLQQFVDEYIALLKELEDAQNATFPGIDGDIGGDGGQDGGEQLYDGMTRDEVIDRMWANANAWHTATSQAEKDRLNAENKYLGSLIGAKFDPVTNTWDVLEDRLNGRYALGTKSAVGGLSMVGERGPEMRVLNPGDGIIPADITRNLWSWGSITPNQMLNKISGFAQSSSQMTTVTIQNFAPNLPNVTDGQGFADYLNNNFLRQVVQFQSGRK